MYKFLGKKDALYQLDLEPISIKLNYNCPADYKNGEGQGSCKGYKPGSETLDSKKTTEKKASIVKPVTKSTVKQPPFNPVDIVNRIRTGGKISKEEYDYILPLINKANANQPANSSASTKTQPTTKEDKSKSLPAKKKDVAETHPGLTKLQSDIKKSGGADKFFDKLKIPDGSDTSLRSVSVKELNSDYPPKFKSAPFATYGNITLHYGKENPKDIIAVAGGKVVGYAMDDSNEEEGLFSVAAVVANEFRGQNLGSKLLYNFYDKNPDKIGKAGSLTPDGKKAFKRVLKGIEDGSFKKVLEVDTKQLPAKQEKTTTKSKLSAKEKDTISEYTGFKYAPINQYLFGKQLNFSPKQETEINQNINNLTNIINNNKINTNMKVYRGLAGQSKEEFLKMVKNVKPGNSFEYAGFMSTSPDKSIGERFATWGNKGKTVLLEIDLPKDSNAMDISKHTASKKYGETEILVAPGFELVLNKVEKNKGADIYHLTYKQSKKETNENVTESKQPLDIKAGSGLDKIRSEIKKAGGAEKFFKTADTHAKDQEERKPIDSEKMARIVNLYTESDTFKKPYKEENGVKWYEAKKDGNSIVIAKVGKKIAAYGLKATDPDDPKNPYTTIVASTDFTGKGYGKQAMLEFYDKNPDMIKKTGGLTPMGKKAYLKTLKTIAGE